MKKIKLYVLFVLLFLVATPNVMAADASISVSSSTKTVIVGNTVKVTVKVSSSDLGSWEYCISYDSSILKLTNSTADANTCVKAGVVNSIGQKNSSETFTFKALKSGTSNVTVKSYAVYAYSDENQMKTNVTSTSIKSMTQKELEATYSTNAYLNKITVGSNTLTPNFDKNTLEYSVEVENDVDVINIGATVADSKSTVTGTGEHSLTEGNNRIEILVTAQKGNSLTYVVNVYRKELDPIAVEYNGVNYTVIRKADVLPNYPTFEATTVEFNGFMIPAYHSEITDLTIIGMKDETGKIGMFIYDSVIVSPYIEIKSNTIAVYPLELPKNDDLKNYHAKEIDFNGTKIDGYVLNDKVKQAIIYAQNVETGKKEYYLYDTEENTVIIYRNDIDEYYENQLTQYKYIIFGLIAFVVILLFIIIVVKPKMNKKAKIKTEEIIKEPIQLEETNKKSKQKKEKKKKKEEIPDDIAL